MNGSAFSIELAQSISRALHTLPVDQEANRAHLIAEGFSSFTPFLEEDDRLFSRISEQPRVDFDRLHHAFFSGIANSSFWPNGGQNVDFDWMTQKSMDTPRWISEMWGEGFRAAASKTFFDASSCAEPLFEAEKQSLATRHPELAQHSHEQALLSIAQSSNLGFSYSPRLSSTHARFFLKKITSSCSLSIIFQGSREKQIWASQSPLFGRLNVSIAILSDRLRPSGSFVFFFLL